MGYKAYPGKRNKPKQDKSESTSEIVRTFLLALVLAFIFRSLLFEPFHIPSGSMRATLLEGDYIFVSKYSYGYSRYSFPLGIPFFDGRIFFNKNPKRGDVIVFRLPANPRVDYIKRLIGMPGDKIKVTNGYVFINGKMLDRKAVEDYAFTALDGTEKRIRRYEDTLPEGRKIQILEETAFGEVDYTDEVTVPEGHYFMMGDNRDNSIDSRYQEHVGFIPYENLIGRAELILFSINEDASLFNPLSWGRLFRNNRFFVAIE